MFDVVVIGAGIMGAAVSRELSKYELKILLLDKENDVSCGTTKANSAIVHAGYDAKEGSLMAKYNVLGNAMYEKLCEEVDAPFRRVGSYVLAFSISFVASSQGPVIPAVPAYKAATASLLT